MLLEAVRATIDRHRMIPPGSRLLVAVSGGLDSVVLLDLLRQLATDCDCSIEIAHLDHDLRPTSAEDARFVAQLADTHRLPFHAERLRPEELARHQRQGLEGAARQARLAFLERTATDIGADCIALGHTANDQAETILYHLVRGTGIRGLRGMAPVRSPYVRPLIETQRSDLLAYAHEKHLSWREDETNANPAFARNRIRHHVLPELEQINPRAIEAICRAGRHAAEADEIAESLATALWDVICLEVSPEDLTLRLDALTAHPQAVRRLLLRKAIRRIRGDLLGIGSDHIGAVERLTESRSAHGSLDLPQLHVQRQADRLRLSHTPAACGRAWTFPVQVGRNAIEEPPVVLDLCLTEGETPEFNQSDRWSEVADADRIRFPLELRSRRDGDRFRPLGMASSVKLKDFLINEQVPFFDRAQLPLLCDRERIVWVLGHRLSEDVRVTEETHRVLSMHVEVGS